MAKFLRRRFAIKSEADDPYVRGCERINHILSQSESYRQILSNRITSDFMDLPQSRDERLVLYLNLLRKSTSKVNLYNILYKDIVLYGKTSNNLREFRFLLNALNESGRKLSSAVFQDEFALIEKAELDNDDVVFRAHAFIAALQNPSTEYLFQHAQYTSIFLSVRESYRRQPRTKPRLAVVANDHSPSQVAFAAVMKGLDVPVVYLQHAEVSPYFPPLDFDVNILRNEKSLRTYRNIGPIRGRTFIVSRAEAPFDAVGINKLRFSNKVTVGIYPTSRFSKPVILRVVKALQNNPAVEEVFVKLHPDSATTITAGESETLHVRQSSPQFPHIAIAGNSSVVIDLVRSGTPVYQLFSIDEIERDYYGFVQAGIAPEISLKDLRSTFWKSDYFNTEWLDRFSIYEPSIKTPQKEMRREMALFIRAIMPANHFGRLHRCVSKALHHYFLPSKLRPSPDRKGAGGQACETHDEV